jgi:hypothetical protein
MGARQLDEDDARARAEESWDQLDVPAAVVCALCGDPGCPGCAFESTTRSGIVAIIPWERPGSSLFGRLWNTARATTKDAESFFGALPDGPVAPALGFALLTELLAAVSWGFVWGPVLVALFPQWCKQVAFDPHARSIALRVIVAALPVLAILLVGAHAAHGVALDRGARKTGAPSSRRRALRFGLYATGWDLVVGPLGACVLAVREGILAAGEVAHLASGLPTRSAKAFLRGAYGLDAARSRVALYSSYVAAVVATLVAAVVIVGVLVIAVIFFPPHLLSY